MKKNRNKTATTNLLHKSLRFPILIETEEDKQNIAKFDHLILLLSELYNSLIDVDNTIFKYNCFLPGWKENYLSISDCEKYIKDFINDSNIEILHSHLAQEVALRYTNAKQKCHKSYKENPKAKYHLPKHKDVFEYKSLIFKKYKVGNKIENNSIIFNKKNYEIKLRFQKNNSFDWIKPDNICYTQIKRYSEKEYELIVVLKDSFSIDLSKKNIMNIFPLINIANKIKSQKQKEQSKTNGKYVRKQINKQKTTKNADQQNYLKEIQRAKQRYIKVFDDSKRIIKNNPKSIGIDFGCGLHNTLTLSDGIAFAMPSRIYDLTIQLEYLKSLLTNKKENSKAFVEMQRKIRKKEKKIVNIRKDFGHKVSKYILQNYDQIFVEDISSKKLSEDNFISRINKQIFNGAFGSMKFNLKYKAEIAGIMEIIKLVKLINPEYTSQICSNTECNYDYADFQKKKLSDRVHKCPCCGLTIDRDLNAAINIEQIGIGLISEQALDRAFGIKFEKIKGLLRSKSPKKTKFDISKKLKPLEPPML